MWGSKGTSSLEVEIRDCPERGCLQRTERGSGSSSSGEPKRPAEPRGPESLLRERLREFGTEALLALRVRRSVDGADFPALGKTKSRSGSKTKAKETWKHLTALIHHSPSFFLCSHYICL